MQVTKRDTNKKFTKDKWPIIQHLNNQQIKTAVIKTEGEKKR